MFYTLLEWLSLGAMVAGVLVITSKDPVVSIILLITVFLLVSGCLFILGTSYLALIYLVVYVGAIAILFLFVVMMLNLRLVELVDVGREYTMNLPIAGLVSFLMYLLVGGLSTNSNAPVSLTSLTTTESLALSSEWKALGINDSTVNVLSSFNTGGFDTMVYTPTHIEMIGQMMYTQGSLWLIIASFLLLVAMIGPIVLCMSNTPNKPELKL